MIELKNVSKTYSNGMVGLQDISLNINKGEFVYLTGKSGSGKSTLLKLLYRDEHANKGQIRVGKYHVTKLMNKDIPYLRRDIGIIFQDFKLLKTHTVFENIAYVLEVTGMDVDKIEERVMEMLRIVELEHKANHYPEECSGGEQQRVAIARAICNSPKIILADEPTGNLDPRITAEIMRVFHKINQMGVAVVVANHDWNVIRQSPGRVIELEDGKIIRDRTKNHMSILFSQGLKKYVVL